MLLEKHYGNPHMILAAYHREIKAWPLLRPSDPLAYKKFYNFLLKCESIMTLQRSNSTYTAEFY